ncbi:Killer toxin subunits alpha/beta 4 [Stagonosporopsis vannaccii]|nr:Killer toxin subunits alpha/beta 4 [Stagonosporopsis vannaccii]
MRSILPCFTLLLSSCSALALVVDGKRGPSEQSTNVENGLGTVVSASSDTHDAGWSRAPPKPAPGKPGPAPGKPAPPPGKPSPSPTPPPKNDHLTLEDNYKVPYPIQAVDTCINLNVCAEQAETPDEIVARNAQRMGVAARDARRDVVHLEKRREDIKAFGGQLTMKSATYYLPYEMYAQPRTNNPKAVFTFSSTDVKTHDFVNKNAAPISTVDLVTEHIIELQTMALFVDHISKGDATLKANLIANWKASVPAAKAKAVNVPWAAQLKSAMEFNDLLFHALGSKINSGVNALCDKGVNGFKADVWVREEPVEKTKYSNLVKAVLGMFDYLNDKAVVDRMQKIVDEATLIFKDFKTLTGKDILDQGKKAVKLDELFQAFIKQHFKSVEAHGKQWLSSAITIAETAYTAEIKKLKADATKLSQQESQKDLTKRKAYIKKVKDDRQKLETAAQPLRNKLETIKKSLKAMETQIETIEKNVAAATTVKAKSTIRENAKWDTTKKELLETRKELIDQQELVNVQQRKIDLLFGGRVAQIARNLEADLKVMKDREAKLASIIKMPTLR